MGNGSTSSADLNARQAYRRQTNTSFDYSRITAAKPLSEQRVHERLDPKRLNTMGRQLRECRDSAEHPNSKGVGVYFDQTASMGEGPIILQQKLATVYGSIMRGGYLADPQILMGAIGDGQNREIAPLQVGQFESDGRFEEDLNTIYLERNGGGNGGESYGLALYFMANFTELDSWDKRGEKAYLFLTGDECPHPYVTRREIKDYLGVEVEADIPIAEVVAAVRKRYEVILLHVNTASAQMQSSRAVWIRLLGEDHVISLDSLETVSETIALTIGLFEGQIDTVDEGAQHLLAEGADRSDVLSASKAVARVAKGRGGNGTVAKATGNLPEPSGGNQGGSRRL